MNMCEGMTMAAFDVDRGLRGSRNRVVAMDSNTMILVDASVLHVMILSRCLVNPMGSTKHPRITLRSADH